MLLPLIHLPGKRFFSIFFFTARICGDSVGMLSAMGNSDSTSRIFNILEGTERPLIGSLSLLASTEHTNIHRMSSVC